ncbi:MAG: VanZ family protein [Gallionella sp.]|nr:VanZ family protein [Gallionella sp.]
MARGLKHHRLWAGAGWLLVALVVYLSLVPHPPEPLSFEHVDKLEHTFAYAMLSFWFCQSYSLAKSRIVVIAALVSMGIGLEFVQDWSGYRMFDVLDMLANSLGVLIGWLLAMTPLGHAFTYIERRLR